MENNLLETMCRYGSSTSTLKNLREDLFCSVTVCHAPPNAAAPFTTGCAGTFQSSCGG